MKQRTDDNANEKFCEVKEKVQQEIRRATNHRGIKRIVFTGTGVLLLLLGIAVPAGAQKDKEDKQDKHEQQGKPEKQANPDKQQQQQKQAKGQQEQQRQQQAKGQQEQQRQQQAKGQQQQQRQQQAKGQQEQQRQQQAKGQQEQQRQQQAKGQQEQQRQQQARRPSEQEQHGRAVEQRDAWQQHRARSWESEHRTWQQRGSYSGYRIPDDRFRVSFGSVHRFRIYSLPVLVVEGYPRFQYGGFWFSLVDPWPEYWSDNWYETDDVYIDYYDGGYYLYNRRHPGVRIAINVFVG
jgi:hypothetical protein